MTKHYNGYMTGDVVLCRLKGYPAWPGKVFQTWQSPNARGIWWWCIVFYPKGDHYWARAGELAPLTQPMIESFLASSPRGKDKEMVAGYEIAKDPREWDAANLLGPARTYEGPNDGRAHGAVKVPPSCKAGGKRARGTSEASSAAPPSTEGSGSSARAKRRATYVEEEDDDDDEDESAGDEDEDEDGRRARVIESKRAAEAQRQRTKTVRTAASRAQSAQKPSSSSASLPADASRTSAASPPPKKKKRQSLPASMPPLHTGPEVLTDDQKAENDMKWVHSMRTHFQRHLIDPDELDPKEMYLASQKLKLLDNWDITQDQVVKTKIAKVLSRIGTKQERIPDGDQYGIADHCRRLTCKWYAQFVSPDQHPPAAGKAQEASAPPPSYNAVPLANGTAPAVGGRGAVADADKRAVREPSVDIVEQPRAPSPECAVLSFPGNQKGDTIIVAADEQAMRIDSAEVAGCRVFREALATADIPREYEDGDQPGTLLMTLNIPDRSQRDVHAFLHLLIGTDESKAITDFASLSTALQCAIVWDAPSIREAVIERLLDRVHAGERVAETFALGAASRSARLVGASLPKFDGPVRRAGRAGSSGKAKAGVDAAHRLRLHAIDPELFALVPHAFLQEFYRLEDEIVSSGATWAEKAALFEIPPVHA